MSHATAHAWSQEGTTHNWNRTIDWHAFATTPRRVRTVRADGQLQTEDDKTKLEKAKEELRQLNHKPESGKSTPLGRKVEKPGESKPGGPSGQKDGAKHDGKHANK